MTIRTDNFVLFPGHVFHDILDTAGIAPGPDVVGRVRILREHHDRLAGVHVSMRDERAAIKETCDAAGVTAYVPLADRVRELARRLDASERDRVGLLATVETLREDLNVSRDKIRKAVAVVDAAGTYGPGSLAERVSALVAERDALRALTRPDVGLPEGWTAANSVIFVGGVSYPAQGPPGNYVVLHVYDSGKTCWGQSGYATPAVYLYLLRAAGVAS